MIEYEYKQSDDSDVLVVVFCGRDNVLNDKWDFYSLNKRDQIDVLWVKDRANLWFQYEEFVDIQDLIEKDYKEIVTLGCSMGGYAATLFGLMIKADRILAFSPQTTLEHPHLMKQKWLAALNDVDLIWPDLKALSGPEAIPGSTVVFSQNNTKDRKHAEHFPYERAITVPGSSHVSWGNPKTLKKLLDDFLTFT